MIFLQKLFCYQKNLGCEIKKMMIGQYVYQLLFFNVENMPKNDIIQAI